MWSNGWNVTIVTKGDFYYKAGWQGGMGKVPEGDEPE